MIVDSVMITPNFGAMKKHPPWSAPQMLDTNQYLEVHFKDGCFRYIN